MKKLDSKKLRLETHAIRTLQAAEAADVKGGASPITFQRNCAATHTC